ncbi:MAG TPA: hypothetical protein VFO91_03610 [Anaerolineales bacterium]|nr:hypothetical protein [Anaerolineales bacterium]
MKQTLDRFILAIPLLFIKQFPYAWIAVVALWTWPPVVPGFLLLIIVIGMLMLRWQSRAWISNLRREHAFREGKFYIDEPEIPWPDSARRILVLLIGAGLLAWLLDGQFRLNSWQLFSLIVGFTLLYNDTRFFGAPVTYIITDRGIGIHFIPGHIDYRLFLPFREISRIEKSIYQKDKGWDLFARTRDVTDGLLMTPKSLNGFTKQIDKLFIAPKDIEKFLEQLPHGYA